MMDAKMQVDHASAFRATRRHFYRQETDGSGNVKRLEKIPWESAIVEIERRTGWILATDAREPDPCQLVLVP